MLGISASHLSFACRAVEFKLLVSLRCVPGRRLYGVSDGSSKMLRNLGVSVFFCPAPNPGTLMRHPHFLWKQQHWFIHSLFSLLFSHLFKAQE